VTAPSLDLRDDVILTLAVDWAPDYAIELAAERLIAYGVRATWLVTHRSAAVDRLRGRPDLFELGIHPNLLPGSTHGAAPADVLQHCLELVPDAVTMRTHGRFQSTPLLELVMSTTPIEIDLSLFLPYAPYVTPVEYHWAGRVLTRLPYVWEDDDEMERPFPAWRPAALIDAAPGLTVFDFHPIHVFLNSCGMAPYRELIAAGGSPLSAAPPELAECYVQDGQGTRSAFEELLARVAELGGGLRARDVLAAPEAAAAVVPAG